MIKHCPGCGGIIGQGCWDPIECQTIAADIAAHQQQDDQRRDPIDDIADHIIDPDMGAR